MSDAARRAHQLEMLDMLKEIDRVCQKHRIAYALFAGTLLGAVRHGGFIPWDDDLDVVFPRAEYARFLRAAPRELDGETYFLQREFSEHWPMPYSKLRRNGTACIERWHPRDPETHQGVYIDLFPCDNLSDFAAVRGMQFAASKLVLAKCLDRRGYLTGSAAKRLLLRVCRPLPMGPLLALAQLRAGAETRLVHTFFGASRRYGKSVYPRAWFAETIPMRFEDGVFPVPARFDALLTTLYGDYRTPAPPAQRELKRHAEIVDLERSYKDYLEIQNHMEIRAYTRSIR